MQRNYKIDRIKGICILFVVVTHFNWSDKQRDLLLFPFWIEMAVPVFMIITGYVFSMSFDNKGCNTLKKIYDLKYTFRRLLRYLIPYFVIFSIELFIYYSFSYKISIPYSIMVFITGGLGPGAYYVPILIQITFFMPLIYLLLQNNPLIGIFLCFALNLLYEVVKTLINMPDSIYRLCAFRYLFILAFGAFLYFYKRDIKKHVIMIIGAIGGGFLIYTEYIGNPPVFLENWTGTCCMACLFACPLLYLALNSNKNYKKSMICCVGKASYNIYLFQMIYYWACFNTICNAIPNWILQFIISILLCLSAGVLFYKIENPITNYIIQKLF